jgi:signal transduction histidine kinase
VLSVLRDVHDQVLAEQERDCLGRRLVAMVEAMFEAHLYLMPVTDADAVMVDLMVMAANPAACRSLRRARHELEGQLVSALLPRQLNHGLEVARHIMATGEAYVADDVRSWNDVLGEYRLYDLRMMRIGEGLALTYHDVTERHTRFDTEARLRAVEVLGTERERLARDLHDGAIQKVFATSLRLASLVTQVPEETRRCVEELIELQDAVIRDLRATVYQLGTTGRPAASPGRSVHDTVTEAAGALGFSPEVMIDDRITRIDEVALGHLLLVLSEALSNVARHASAHHVEVSLVPAGSDVILSVWDDGVGLPLDGPRGDGLRNMARRAALLGGSSRVNSEPGGGTEVIWRVPQSAR